jgi:serine/threonine protein kinase
VVKKFILNPTNKEIAVKEFSLPLKRTFGKNKRITLIVSDMEKILNEIEIFYKMSSKDHIHIVQFYGWSFNREYVHIYMEPMYINLRKIMDISYLSGANDRIEKYILINKMIVSVLSGLLACRNMNISHGDLKPENILINLNGQVKLCDFGASRNLKNGASRSATLIYNPPEIFDMDSSINSSLLDEEKLNVWSLGMIIVEMIGDLNPILESYSDDSIPFHEGFINFGNAIKEEDYIDPLFINLRKGLGYYDKFVGECLKPKESRPGYEELMAHRIYINPIEKCAKEYTNFILKQLIDYLEKVCACIRDVNVYYTLYV